MTRFLRTYLPAVSMAFTFIVLYAAVYNVLSGYTKEGFCFFILEVVGYLAMSMLIDYLISMIDFKKYIYHFSVETILLYPITIGASIMGKWFHINIFNIIWYSCVYVIAMIAIHYYFYYISKKQAYEINTILQKNKRSDCNG